jgi:hypothetical protein
MKFKVTKKKRSHYLSLAFFIIIAAVRMARESNVSVIQTLQKELDTHLQQVRKYTEHDTQLNTAVSALQ